jgi:hypothetical protein
MTTYNIYSTMQTAVVQSAVILKCFYDECHYRELLCWVSWRQHWHLRSFLSFVLISLSSSKQARVRIPMSLGSTRPSPSSSAFTSGGSSGGGSYCEITEYPSGLFITVGLVAPCWVAGSILVDCLVSISSGKFEQKKSCWELFRGIYDPTG